MNLNQVTVPLDDYASPVVFYRLLGLTQIVERRLTMRGSNARAGRPFRYTGRGFRATAGQSSISSATIWMRKLRG